MQEVISCNWMGVFHVLGKQNYMEICLKAVDKEYGWLDYSILQQVWCNLSVRYHAGSDYRGYEYVLCIMDEPIENINMWTKTLPLQSHTD